MEFPTVVPIPTAAFSVKSFAEDDMGNNKAIIRKVILSALNFANLDIYLILSGEKFGTQCINAMGGIPITSDTKKITTPLTVHIVVEDP